MHIWCTSVWTSPRALFNNCYLRVQSHVRPMPPWGFCGRGRRPGLYCSSHCGLGRTTVAWTTTTTTTGSATGRRRAGRHQDALLPDPPGEVVRGHRKQRCSGLRRSSRSPRDGPHTPRADERTHYTVGARACQTNAFFHMIKTDDFNGRPRQLCCHDTF